MTYTTRRLEIATEMAKSKLGTDSGIAQTNKMVQHCFPLADIALKHMAEETDDAYTAGWFDGDKGVRNCYTYIQSRGLVPEKEEK